MRALRRGARNQRERRRPIRRHRPFPRRHLDASHALVLDDLSNRRRAPSGDDDDVAIGVIRERQRVVLHSRRMAEIAHDHHRARV